MSAKVNVLSILQSQADAWDPKRSESAARRHAEYVEAHDAIADLIEAGNRSLSWLSSYPGDGALRAYEHMRAALAKVTP